MLRKTMITAVLSAAVMTAWAQGPRPQQNQTVGSSKPNFKQGQTHPTLRDQEPTMFKRDKTDYSAERVWGNDQAVIQAGPQTGSFWNKALFQGYFFIRFYPTH